MTAEATVNDIITDARSFADDSYDAASSLVQSAQSASTSSVSLTPRRLYFTAPDPVSLDHDENPGNFEDGFTIPAGKPEVPLLETLHIPELPDFPDAPDTLDTSGLFQFDRPAFDLAGFTKTAPDVDTDITFPNAPVLQEYEAPETSELDLRATPSVTAPVFDPGVTISTPEDAPDFVAAYKTRITDAVPQFRDWVETYSDAWIDRYAPEYHTALAKLESKIADGYEGNTAMPDAVEQQIFDRGVSRAEQERGSLDSEAAERFSRRGYTLPPVALSSQMAANQRAVARNAADVSRDLAIRRSELEHQHVQFVMQISSSLRDAMRNQVMQYANLLVTVNGQALQDAQQVGALMTEAYRFMFERARLDHEHLKTLAAVYETELKSALIDLEIFKVEMEAAKTRKDAELADVEVWAKKIDAQNTRINLHLAELRAITERVGVERLRVDIFGQEVSAYTALTNAKESEFGAYRAAISGDEALVSAHSEKVRAYGIETDAARTKIQAESALTDVGVQYNRNLIDVFKAELSGWLGELDAEGKRFDGSTSSYRSRLDLYKTRLSAQLDEQRSVFDSSKLDLDAQRSQVDADLKVMLAQADLLSQRIGLIANTAMAGASAHADMASSAVSAQNTMVNLVNETVN